LKDGRSYASGIYSEKTGKSYDAYIVLEDDGAHSLYRLEFDRERIDDAAHMNVAIGKFYPRLRLIGVRLPREEVTFIPYLERATTLMGNALLDSDVFLSFDALRYDSDSNHLCYLWFPYELEGTEVSISANLLLVMNGLCDYVPEDVAGGGLHVYMNQTKTTGSSLAFLASTFRNHLRQLPSISLSRSLYS